MQVWIVCKVTSQDGKCFEIQGVFSSEERAIAACKGPNWFIGPEILDQEIAPGHIKWEGGYYPLVVLR